MSESYENPSARYHQSNLHEQSETREMTPCLPVSVTLRPNPGLVGIQPRPLLRLCYRGLFILLPVLRHVVG